MSATIKIEAVKQKLIDKGITTECRMCGNNGMMIHNNPVSMIAVDGNGGYAPQPNTETQLIQVTCEKCGHVELFNFGYLVKE